MLSRSATHLLLDSFPTRRSSDLVARVGDVQGRIEEVEPFEKERTLFGEEDREASIDGDLGYVRFDLREVGVEGEVEDRKSTRLNSSHLVISYAVFCLKKKRDHAR